MRRVVVVSIRNGHSDGGRGYNFFRLRDTVSAVSRISRATACRTRIYDSDGPTTKTRDKSN